MSIKKMSVVLGVLLIASMVLTACPAPQPQVVEKVVTQVVEQKVEVVQTQIVEVEKVVEKEKIVVATAVPEAKPALLRINLGAYPDVIDPQKSSYVNEIAHLKLIYEGLTKFNEKLETVPGAAEKWEYNADATELTFTLRPDLKYSDGTPLNAKRFEYALIRNINPETAGEYASITDEIKGAPEWRNADTAAADYDAAKFKAELGVKAPAMPRATPAPITSRPTADTLKLTFSKPAPYFHTIMGIWVAYPAKEELISEGGENWWNSSKYQIGNGPFILKSLEPFVRGAFTPNANYWGDKPTYDMEFSYIVDTAVAFEAYKNDEFEIVDLAGEDLETVQGDPVLSKEAHDLPRLLHHRHQDGPGCQVQGSGRQRVRVAVPGQEGARGVRLCVRRRRLGQGRGSGSVDRDLDLDPARVPWLRRGLAHEVRPRAGQEDAGRVELRRTREAERPGPEDYLPRQPPQPHPLRMAGPRTTRKTWASNIALDPVDATTFTALTKDPATFPLLRPPGLVRGLPGSAELAERLLAAPTRPLRSARATRTKRSTS